MLPGRFHRHFEEPSFDIKDLDTVDNTVIGMNNLCKNKKNHHQNLENEMFSTKKDEFKKNYYFFPNK